MRLSVFDLSAVSEGTTPRETLRSVMNLVSLSEEWGYHGYWFGEHHLGRGRVGSAPIVLTALAAERTSRLHVGSAVAVLPHYRPLALVEQISTIAELHPGRVHLGIGKGLTHSTDELSERVSKALQLLREPVADLPVLERADHPVLLRELLAVSPSDPEGYDHSVREVLSLLQRPIGMVDGRPLQATPGLAAPVLPWLFASAGRESAVRSARLGLPFVVNNHVIDSPVEDAVVAYRESFVPSQFLAKPYVAVSVHAVAADTEAEAYRLAESYPVWISGVLARGFSDTLSVPGDGSEEAPVDQKRLRSTSGTRIIGTARAVSERVHAFGQSIEADEVLVNTLVHGERNKARSYELLAREWPSTSDHSGSAASTRRDPEVVKY
ncbi:LLM class flavin-dependent oxidoreductase [Rhodococcus globerulus]|uniref:LLM class flavin-dependent oxidoreductase n=1 Tax=Rhodococcus globerulus TaxID=33008 RepID=A0ABU4C4J5_RHOGO|nr:LLM class flavin-dependent oxidoreductase [Rhodococcus globerulus]MDV6271438.1 LLM class flavin-dependent oxidoreductase [Rhodococcus globerulus]